MIADILKYPKPANEDHRNQHTEDRRNVERYHNGLRVHIEGMETRQIAKQQARDRIRELKQAGLL